MFLSQNQTNGAQHIHFFLHLTAADSKTHAGPRTNPTLHGLLERDHSAAHVAGSAPEIRFDLKRTLIGAFSMFWVCLKMLGIFPMKKQFFIGIMISKTIGYNGVHYFQTHPFSYSKSFSCIVRWRVRVIVDCHTKTLRLTVPRREVIPAFTMLDLRIEESQALLPSGNTLWWTNIAMENHNF